MVLAPTGPSTRSLPEVDVRLFWLGLVYAISGHEFDRGTGADTEVEAPMPAPALLALDLLCHENLSR